jgi:hypothetical protein
VLQSHQPRALRPQTFLHLLVMGIRTGSDRLFTMNQLPVELAYACGRELDEAGCSPFWRGGEAVEECEEPAQGDARLLHEVRSHDAGMVGVTRSTG